MLRERGTDPFRVLVSTVLSHRTRDEVTERVSLRLLAAFPSPAAMASASTADIRALVGEAGLSWAKAAGLHCAAQQIVSEFDGRVPSTLTELVSLPLVGKKTANAVLVFGFRKPAIPVDTHILRVTNRLGVIHAKTLDDGAASLELVVPRRYWGRLNPVLVQHGQNLCRARDPRCEECPIIESCDRVGL